MLQSNTLCVVDVAGINIYNFSNTGRRNTD